MLAACRKIFNCIRDVFNKVPRFDKEIKEKANKIEENQFIKNLKNPLKNPIPVLSTGAASNAPFFIYSR